MPPARMKSALGSMPRTCSVWRSGVRISSRSFLWPKAETPLSRIGILVPAEAGVVAGPADGDRVGEGADVAGGVEHQRHAAADAVAEEPDGGALLGDVALVPAVHLEGAVAERVAGLGEVGEVLGRRQAAVAVAVHGRGIGGEPLPPAAEERGDGQPDALAVEVPERDVDVAEAHVVVLAVGALELVVDQLALERVAADEVRGEHQDLGERDRRRAPQADILAARRRRRPR